MGSGGHKYKYIPDYTANNAAAEQARLEWARYQDAYAPLSRKLAGELDPEVGRADINEAQTTAGDMQENANQAMIRKMSEYGMQLSPLQRQALAAKFAANKNLSGVAAANMERRAVKDRTDLIREGLVNEGAGIRSMSNNALNSAASLEQERNAAGYGIAAAKTARSQSRVQAAMGLAGQTAGTAATVAILS